MRKLLFVYLSLAMLCTSCSEAPPPSKLAPITTGQYVGLGAQNGQAVRYANTSAYYKRALSNAVRASTTEEILQLNARRRMTVQIADGLPTQLGDDVAKIVRTAGRKPNRNTILAGLASAGLVTAVYLLDEEEEKRVAAAGEQQTLPIGTALSDAELEAKMSQFNGLIIAPNANRPKAEAPAFAAPDDSKRKELFDQLMRKSETLKERAAIQQSLQVAGVRKLKHPLTQVPGAEIALVIELPPSDEICWFSVYLFGPDGQALKPKSNANRDPETGQLMVRNFLMGSAAKRTFTADSPYRIFIPFAASDALQEGQPYQCRIVFHGSSLEEELAVKSGILNL